MLNMVNINIEEYIIIYIYYPLYNNTYACFNIYGKARTRSVINWCLYQLPFKFTETATTPIYLLVLPH